METAFLTLHVGAGTFQPVRTAEVEEHHMHAEYIDVGAQLCASVMRAHAEGRRVIAVGTTSLRGLEAASDEAAIRPFQGDTAIFIYPGYRFRCVDALVTNFHLPESTLLMLVSAFAGRERVLAAYAEAVERGYRFFSYGDAMFVAGRTAPAAQVRTGRPRWLNASCSSRCSPATAPRAAGGCSFRAARSKRPRSCRWAPTARSRACCRATSRRSARRSCSATRST